MESLLRTRDRFYFQSHNERLTRQFDLDRGARERDYAPGEKIHYITYHRHYKPWKAGYILGSVEKVPYMTDSGKRTITRHTNQSRKYLSATTSSRTKHLRKCWNLLIWEHTILAQKWRDDISMEQPKRRWKSGQRHKRGEQFGRVKWTTGCSKQSVPQG